MNLAKEMVGSALFVAVEAPRIDAASAIQFKDTMREISGETDGKIILDLSMVDFIDSSGLGAIVAAMKQMGPERRLELASLSSTVAKVFSLTRMDSVFTIYPDRDSAVANASLVS
ncbi:MAG: STAS domain-containing protein [Pseudomonadota bacterium]